MKKFCFLLVFFGALLFCACEKENADLLLDDPALTQLEDSALKGADKNGMTQENLTPWPLWARMASGAEFVIPATDEYGIIIFYVNDLELIPDDWNFYPGNWFASDFWLIPEEKWTVEGTAWRLPGNEIAPHHYHAKGKGAVPVWIITFDQVMELYNSGVVTIPKIEACTPMVGYATSYNEVLRPYGGGAPVLGGVISAKGTLDDGRKFIYHMHSKLKEGGPMEAQYHLSIIDK